MAWQEPKIDWAPQDKYNFSDLTRVESNTAHLAARLEYAGYPPAVQAFEMARTMQTIEFAESLNRVEQNIEALHHAFVALPGKGSMKTWVPVQMAFDYRDAIRLENNLAILYAWLESMIASFRYCGAFYCGEEGDII